MKKKELKNSNITKDNKLSKIRYVINGLIALIVYFFILPKKRKKDYILIGSHLGEHYADNNKVFFEYCIEKGEDIYWVLNKNSIAEKINPYKEKIVHRGSIKGFLMAYRSKILVVSHSFSDVLPIFYKLKKPLSLKAVFVSHGVYGFKKAKLINPDYYQQFDFITAVGETEKLIKKNALNLEENKIKVVGLPRFDKLSSNKGDNNILLMLTWREERYSNIEESDYYIHLKNLVHNKRLIKFLQEKGIKINIVLHSFFHQYYDSIQNLSNEKIVILPRNVDIQEQLISNSLLITDYSSVAWDFAYMNKPVIFYQFDLDKYLNSRGSYLDLNNDLFGIKAHTVDETVNAIINVVEGNYILQDKKKSIKDYVEFIDNKNCDRLYEAIQSVIL